MSGTANASGTASGKMLLFDNTFNATAGQGIPANKIRLHNNNNAWIGGFGLEGGGVTYNSGDSHRFYVGSSGSKYGDLALNIDSAKNTTLNGNLSVGGKLILSNNTQLSADGDDATHWLRLQQANNPGQYKSFAAQDIWCAQGTLSSGTINNGGNATINGGLRFGGGIGAYMVDGGCCLFPIFCSMANCHTFGMGDRDDYYVLLPGYKILLFTSYNYLNDKNENNNQPLNAWDNTGGFTSIFCDMKERFVNRTSSFRLYYLGIEVRIDGMS
jgi:hypothetical protein